MSPLPRQGDLLVVNGTVVTVDARRRILTDGAVLVRAGRIAAVDKREALEPLAAGVERIDARGGLVLPGLVDAHVHLNESIMRGFAADLGHARWISERLRPVEAALTRDDLRLSIELSLLEYLRSGITTFGESLLQPGDADDAAGLVLASGLRGALSFAYAGPEDADAIRAAHAAWDGREDRLRIFTALRPLAATGPDAARACGQLTRELGTRLSWHFQPYAKDPRPLTVLARKLDLLWPGAVLGHSIGLGAEDIAALAESGASVVTLPYTNTRLGMEFCPVPELLAAGATVAVGTDGDNPHDMFATVALLGCFHKGRSRHAEVLPVETLIEMATLHGARALGMEHEIGSLEVGKRADLIVVSVDGPWLQPLLNPLAALVYGGSGRDVTTVVVDGRVLLRDGRQEVLDEARILAEAPGCATRLLRRAGLLEAARPKWPTL